MKYSSFIAEKNPVDWVVVVGGVRIRVIIIPLRGPSDQMRLDPQLVLRCQIGPSVATTRNETIVGFGRVTRG